MRNLEEGEELEEDGGVLWRKMKNGKSEGGGYMRNGKDEEGEMNGGI